MIPQKGKNGFSRADFDMGNILGQGESGSVILANHRSTQVQYALKEINIGAAETRHQMCKELQAHQECGKTDHIVDLYDFFAHEGRVYLVLEYMDWGSLDNLLKQQRLLGLVRMDEGVISVIIGSILHALDFLHRIHNLIHRDLKPGNIVVSRSGIVKLSDFGVSRVLNMEGKGTTFVGTAAYMSPERLEGRQYTSKADIWSIGIIIVECALGRHPYLGHEASFFDLMQRVVYEPAAVPTSSGLSDELVAFLHCCIVKDEASRSSAQDLLQHPFITSHAHKGFGIVRDWLAQIPPAPH
jgi:serine/threonine protein kinase